MRPFSSVATLLFINTEHVKPEEMRTAERSAQSQVARQDLHRRSDHHGRGRQHGGAVLQSDLGEDFVRKSIYRSEDGAYARAPADDRLVGARHPADLSQLPRRRRPAAGQRRFQDSRNFRAHRYSGPTINGSPWMLSLANKAPHPKAAQVFANWILSKEGLETYARGYGSATLRTDIDESYLNPGNMPKKGVKYFDDTDWKWIVTGRHEYREKVWQVLKKR